MAIAESHPVPPLATPWRQALPALVLALGVVLVAYRETLASMLAIWARSETFAHAFLVPPIVLWLIWRQRDVLATLQPRPNPWVLLPMAATGLLWFFGDLASLNSVTQLAMTALLVLAVPAVLGLQVARAIRFPLLFLFFAVPIGEFLLPQLMSWTADFTALALRMSGIPVFREGMQIVIPSGHWSVVEACSGVRYLIASFMVGTLFAYLHYRSPGRRWAFVGVSILVPVLANWVRAYLIVLLGHLSNNRLAVGADHLIYGWVFFGLVMALMFGIGMVWSEPEAERSAKTDVSIRTGAGSARTANLWWITACAVALIAVPQLAARQVDSVDTVDAPRLAPMNSLAGGWQASPTRLTEWVPAYHEPSAKLDTTYTQDGRQVGLYIAYYRGQSREHKLLSSNNQLVMSTDPVWARIGTDGEHTLEMQGTPLTLRTTTLRSATRSALTDQQLTVWQTYWVAGRLTTNEGWATLHGALDRLLGRGDDAAVILLYTPLEQGGGSTAALEAFARANLALITARLRETRDGSKAIAATQR